jgi:hypothetical protein
LCGFDCICSAQITAETPPLHHLGDIAAVRGVDFFVDCPFLSLAEVFVNFFDSLRKLPDEIVNLSVKIGLVPLHGSAKYGS